VNGWYGVYLYGLGIGDQRITDLGRLLMATELRFVMFSYEYLATKKEVESTDNRVHILVENETGRVYLTSQQERTLQFCT
jgi:hypothetical protein